MKPSTRRGFIATGIVELPALCLRATLAANDGASARGAKRHVQIGSTAVDVKPSNVDSSIHITSTDPKSERARDVVDRLVSTLQIYMTSTVNKNYQDTVDSLTARYNSLGHSLDRIAKQWALCKTADKTCQRNARSTYISVQTDRTQVKRNLNKVTQVGRQPITLRAGEVDAADQPAASVVRKHKAGSSTIPVAMKPRLVLGFMVGFLLGALVAFLVGKLDSSVFGVQSTETAARLPVLAEIPHVSTSRRRRFEVLTQLSPLSGVADSYRGLRTSIGLMWLANESETGRTEPRTLIIASPGPNEGKSTSSANLAAAYAEMGKNVVVVDLDFRRQRLHKFLGANAEPHLANLGTLSQPVVDLDAITQASSIPGVRFIGSAAPDSTPAEASVAGRAAIRAARESADIVIIDTPPLLLTNDTFDLLDMADAVLLLVRDGRTKSAALTRAAQQLRRLDAPVLGIALIGAVSSRPGYGYGYGYGYRYGYSYGGYGYGYGARTGLEKEPQLDDSFPGPDDAPVPVLLTEPDAKPRRRFGLRKASDAPSDGPRDTIVTAEARVDDTVPPPAPEDDTDGNQAS